MTCGKLLKEGQWWRFCGETDMGQTVPVQCTECGGEYELASPERQAEYEAAEAKTLANHSDAGYYNLYTGEGTAKTIQHSIGDGSGGKVWVKLRNSDKHKLERDPTDDVALGWQPKWFIVKRGDGTFAQVDNPGYVEPPSEPDEEDADEDDEGPKAVGAWTYSSTPGVVTHLTCTIRPSWLKRKLCTWATGFDWVDYK